MSGLGTALRLLAIYKAAPPARQETLRIPHGPCEITFGIPRIILGIPRKKILGIPKNS